MRGSRVFVSNQLSMISLEGFGVCYFWLVCCTIGRCGFVIVVLFLFWYFYARLFCFQWPSFFVVFSFAFGLFFFGLFVVYGGVGCLWVVVSRFFGVLFCWMGFVCGFCLVRGLAVLGCLLCCGFRFVPFCLVFLWVAGFFWVLCFWGCCWGSLGVGWFLVALLVFFAVLVIWRFVSFCCVWFGVRIFAVCAWSFRFGCFPRFRWIVLCFDERLGVFALSKFFWFGGVLGLLRAFCFCFRLVWLGLLGGCSVLSEAFFFFVRVLVEDWS